MNAKTRKKLEAAGFAVGSADKFLGLTASESLRVGRRLKSPTPLPPPAGYSSWLAYAVATMDDRSLQNDHDEGHQLQWPARVTRAQMRAAARAELEWIEGIWSEIERALPGKVGDALDLLESEFGHRKTTVTAEELETSRKLHAARKASGKPAT